MLRTPTDRTPLILIHRNSQLSLRKATVQSYLETPMEFLFGYDMLSY